MRYFTNLFQDKTATDGASGFRITTEAKPKNIFQGLSNLRPKLIIEPNARMRL
jgi:hypothetical protein